MDKTLWIPLAVLFGTALITALVKRYSKDICLKIFNGCFVFVRLKNGKWLWGKLIVYPNALELIYSDPAPFHQYEKHSYIFYEQNLENIDRIIRPSPAAGSEAHRDWEAEIEQLQNPSIWRLFRRRARNTINLLRDAFTQSFVMIFGAVKKTRAGLASVAIGDDKVSEVGRSLINVVPNAYEPILEKYLGRIVVVETVLTDKLGEQVGVLQEYSARYILIRGTKFLLNLPPFVESAAVDNQTFDVALPRTINTVRHLAEPAPLPSPVSPPESAAVTTKS